MTTLAAGLGITDLNAKSATEPGAAPIAASGDMIGRPVRIVSIGLAPVHLPDIGAPPHPRSLDEIAGLVDKEGARGTDVIILPELCQGQDANSLETLEGPTITTIARLAQKHQTYVVCPIDRKEGERRYNSAVLLDRKGQVANIYNKYDSTPADAGAPR
jgi:hypothetical protein